MLQIDAGDRSLCHHTQNTDWYVTPCGQIGLYRLLEGRYCFDARGGNVSTTAKTFESKTVLFSVRLYNSLHHGWQTIVTFAKFCTEKYFGWHQWFAYESTSEFKLSHGIHRTQ